MTMDDPTQVWNPSQDRLVDAVQEYLRETESGKRPARRDFLARYPHIADDLSACLDGLAFVQSAAGGLDNRPTAAEIPIDPQTARPLGDFRLIRQIGRGGMGVVYEAEQISLDRRVALKVLPLAAALDPRQLQRFRNEALAAAQLHHTNVVPVYAVGCERSVHFYAMQLIDGNSIADVIRALQAAPEARDDSAASSLATQHRKERQEFYRTVALLGSQAADGLEYAHSRGVIHRDIKPGNLLLDTAGTLWIADFGLAQLHADVAIDRLTRSGDILGTLRYMSPEQASGRAVLLDERADIYSLGATLFELLTLRPAITGQTQLAMIKEIQSAEPPSARQVDPNVPAELDLILRKAMANEVYDRYQSAEEFASDLRRFLDDEPIKAKPPTPRQRAARWARRHRVGVEISAGILCFALIGLLITTILVARANHRVHLAYGVQQQQTMQAEHAYRKARDAVDLLTRFAAEELGDDPMLADERRHLLSTAMGYYDTFMVTPGARRAGDTEEIDQARQTITALLDELNARDQLRRAGEPAEFLGIDPVRRELGIGRGDVDFQAIREAFFFDMRSTSDLTPQQRSAFFQAVTARGTRALNEALSDDQRQRLQQITWQFQGARAFSDPEIVEALALTAEQQAAMNAALVDLRDQWEVYKPGVPDGPRQPREGRSKQKPKRYGEGMRIHAEGLQSALEILTPSQQERWKQLIGKTFPREDIPIQFGTGFGPFFGTTPENNPHHPPRH